MLIVLLCAVAMVVAPCAVAQDMRQEQQTTAGGLTVVRRGEMPPVVGGHAWIARQERVTSPNLPTVERTIVLHLPPRTGGPQEQRGVIRFAGGFESATDRTAWWGNRVFFALPPERSSLNSGGDAGVKLKTRAPLRRTILGLTALRGAGSSYSYAPGRPEVLPSLDGTGKLVGFVGTRVGPAALISAEDLRLWLLSGGGGGGGTWTRAPFAWEMGLGDAPGKSERVVLLPWRDGVVIAVASGGEAAELRLYAGRVVRPEPGGAASPVVTVRPLLEWRLETRRIGAEVKLGDLGGLRFVEGASPAEDALVNIFSAGQSRWDVHELRASGPVSLGVVADVPGAEGGGGGAELVAMASPGEGGAPGNLAFVWTVPTGSEAGGAGAERVSGGGDKYMIREFSALTGREKYAGLAKNPGLLARGQYQILVILLLAVMIGVVVFVLRGDPQVVPMAPKGTAFAEPVRRALAALFDYAPSAVLVALALGRGPMALLVPERALEGAEMDLTSVGMVLVVTIAHCTLSEWFFGRSLGKFFLGCRVVSTAEAGGDPKVRLWQALVRNVVKWTVPILGVFIIFEPARRHPGDLAARTIVVCEEPERGE